MSQLISWSHLLLAAAALVLTAAGNASATSFQATASTIFGPPIEVILTVDDAAVPGSLVITLEVSGAGSTIGDLRGFFTHVSNESLIDGLSIEGASVTSTSFLSNSVIDMGTGSNLIGSNSPCPCDLGVDLGTPGVGQDDLQTVSFTLSHSTEALDVSLLSGQSFGVRVSSIGNMGDDCRDGSSKVVGVVPEPGTALLIGLGLAGLSAARPRSAA